MATQKYMGKGVLVKRLAAQVGSESLAKNILRSRGDMKRGSDDLTAKGKARNAMTAEDRAKDRAAKNGGGKPSDYTYHPKTNSTSKKSKPTTTHPARGFYA